MIYRIENQDAVKDWAEISGRLEAWHPEKPEIKARVITAEGVVHRLDRVAMLPWMDYGRALIVDEKSESLKKIPEITSAENVYRESRQVTLAEYGMATLAETDDENVFPSRQAQGGLSRCLLCHSATTFDEVAT